MYSLNPICADISFRGKGENAMRSAKAASNRYPYLISSCGRAQIFLPLHTDAPAYHSRE